MEQKQTDEMLFCRLSSYVLMILERVAIESSISFIENPFGQTFIDSNSVQNTS